MVEKIDPEYSLRPWSLTGRPLWSERLIVDPDYSLRSWNLTRRSLVMVRDIDSNYSLSSWSLTKKPLFMVGEIGLMNNIKCSHGQWGSNLTAMGFG